jgi:hypothetical protein
LKLKLFTVDQEEKMRRLISLACLCICLLPALPALASDSPPFQIIYRQENVVSDEFNTRSDLMITVINLSGSEAREIVVSIPVLNPFLFVDSPVFVFGTSIPDGHQAEVLHESEMPNDLIALAEPLEKLVWRVEYTNDAGERASIDVKGVDGN